MTERTEVSRIDEIARQADRCPVGSVWTTGTLVPNAGTWRVIGLDIDLHTSEEGVLAGSFTVLMKHMQNEAFHRVGAATLLGGQWKRVLEKEETE